MNPHIPERLPGETRESYLSRREQSREITKTLTKGPRQAPAPIPALANIKDFWLGKHRATPEKRAKRELIALYGYRQWRRLTQESYRLKALTRLA